MSTSESGRRIGGPRAARRPGWPFVLLPALLPILLLGGCAGGGAGPAPSSGDLSAVLAAPRLGRPVPAEALARGDRHVFPDGRGLPPGRGSVAQGARLYQAQCAACHGVDGRGLTAEELVGGVGSLATAEPEKTVGSYWPHATTLFDFIRRAMPLHAPGSLQADEVYALSAWLLHANGILPADAVLDAAALAAVRMPNRAGFVAVDDPRRPPP